MDAPVHPPQEVDQIEGGQGSGKGGHRQSTDPQEVNAADSRNDRQRGPKSRSRRDAQGKRIGQRVEEHPLVDGSGQRQSAAYGQGEDNPGQAHVNDDVANGVIDVVAQAG